ncbi:MAG TPA: hypothetical protein VD763_02160 [Candidatus Saccharimonadales bacterium]|nr:hypothetical protein [Candidatus Saccharimonadales bacterium]
MTIDALRQKSGRTRGRRKAEEPALVIGERDTNIFDCPACARPLAVGSSRCPGCGARLIVGVQAGRAMGFMAIGLVAGALIGGGVMAGVSALDRAQAAVATVPVEVPIVRPSAAPAVPSAMPSIAPIVDPAVPASALSALRQSAILHQRIVVEADRLAAALAVEEPSSVEIAKALRALSSDATFGSRLAPGVAAWGAASAVSTDLADFYAAIAATAKEGLSVSIQSTDSYIDAGQQMITVIAGLGEVDAASRRLAMTVDLDLPPVLRSAAPAP